MTPAQLEPIIDARLAILKAKMLAQNCVPIFLVGYDGDSKKGRYGVAWAAGEQPNLEETHKLLTAMLEEVAAKLGVL